MTEIDREWPACATYPNLGCVCRGALQQKQSCTRKRTGDLTPIKTAAELRAVAQRPEGRQYDPDHCTACGDWLPCGESWIGPSDLRSREPLRDLLLIRADQVRKTGHDYSTAYADGMESAAAEVRAHLNADVQDSNTNVQVGLVVIDPESHEQAQRLADHLIKAMCKQDPDWDVSIAHEIRAHTRAALREYAKPLPALEDRDPAAVAARASEEGR